MENSGNGNGNQERKPAVWLSIPKGMLVWKTFTDRSGQVRHYALCPVNTAISIRCDVPPPGLASPAGYVRVCVFRGDQGDLLARAYPPREGGWERDGNRTEAVKKIFPGAKEVEDDDVPF